MKNLIPSPRIAATLVAAFFFAQSLHAAPTWNNAAGGNWSIPGNWSPSGIPGTASGVIFGNTGAGFPNTNDISGETINSLTYNQDNGSQQTTVINPGQTLTINSSVAAGTGLLFVGSAGGAATAATLTPVAITGNASLVLSGVGDIVIHQGFTGANGAHIATLDLSGLDNFTANVGRLLIGQDNGGNNIFNRPAGSLILAKTNNLTFTGASPQVIVQDSVQNGNANANSSLIFGQKTFLNGDTMRLGGQKANANLNFNGAFSLPSLTIRNSDGISPVSTIDFGYHAAAASGNTVTVVSDFTPGTVDLMANLVNIAQGNPGAGLITSTLTLGAGTFDVNTFELGFGIATAGNAGPVTATVNINNNGNFPAGALLKVNTTLRLARTNGGSGVINGTLNVNGGKIQANTIVAGGGVSTINLISASPSSTLIISNTAGTLTAPIRNFSMNDATLTIPALNGGAVVAVSNLTVGGSANVINISSIPPIGSYPADFTLINYLSGYTAGTGPLSLGPLPAGGYSGTLVDTGGGVIKLHLTAGPVVNLGMLWTGATDNNWDLTTYNWTFLGIATNFFNGSSPLFNDTSAQTNVFLATAVSPGSITVSNNTRAYSFVGSGNIAGASTLTKRGTSSLTVANAGVDTIGTVVISSGTLQIGTNDLNGEISAVSITNSGALVVNRSGSYTLSAAISGPTGTLTKRGDGTLVLSGANSYGGTTTLSGGTLQIDGTSSGAGALTTSAGTVLAGGGTVNGAVAVGGQMNPGSPSATGIFNANAGLTLSSGSTLTFDLSATAPSNPALNDSINVVGNLNVNGNKITVNFDGSTPGGQYTLFTYSGTLSGSFNPVINGTHFTATLDTTTLGFVYLNISGSGSDLSWASISDSTWDSITTNWLNLSSSAPSVFYAGDSVLLDDSNSVTTTLTLASGVTVSPSAITDNATNNSFIISGAGHIAGSGGIVKSGPASLEIDTANSFSGTVDVQAGTLKIGSGTALGAATSGTTVADGATLDLNAQNIGGESVTISGAGADGSSGALVNTGGAAPVQSLRTLTLASDATVGGTGLILMNNSGGGATLTGAFNLTKVGANSFTLQNLTTVDLNLRNIDIQQGILNFSGTTPTMGDATSTNIVAAGATLQLEASTRTWAKQFVFNGNGSTATVTIGNSGDETLDGPVELHGDCVFNVGGISLTINGVISADGGLIKNGGSPLILTNINTYTGDTRINTGALRLNGDGSISTSSNITIAAGATLSVTGRVDSTFTLVSGQTLKGNGVINGKLTASAGSTVSPGLDAIGALIISNQVVLSGTNIMELDQDNGTNDVLRSNSSITYGGILNLVNLGSPLTNGASFKLFNASSYLSSFASISPATPGGAGQTWDTSALNTTGTLKVTGAGTPTPGPVQFSVSGSTLMLVYRGTNAGNYYLLTSTNVTLPRASWTPVATNVLNATGLITNTASVNAGTPQRFYTVQAAP